MNFRTQTVKLFAMLLLLYLPRHTEAESLPKSLGESRPNIVLIISDDHAWMDYGFMGNERVHTPNLDALAAKAAQLPNSYVPSSVCRPSLASILTGLYPHQHGIHFNHGPPGNSGYNRIDSQTEYEKKRKIEIERRMHPKKGKDFDILFNELEAWRLNETKKIKNSTELNAEEKKLALQ